MSKIESAFLPGERVEGRPSNLPWSDMSEVKPHGTVVEVQGDDFLIQWDGEGYGVWEAAYLRPEQFPRSAHPRFHKYGPVDVRISEADGEGPVTYANYLGCRFQDSERLDDQPCDWIVIEWDEKLGEKLLPGEAHPLSEDRRFLNRASDGGEYIADALDAASLLAWRDYEEFQLADARMGDPNP